MLQSVSQRICELMIALTDEDFAALAISHLTEETASELRRRGAWGVLAQLGELYKLQPMYVPPSWWPLVIAHGDAHCLHLLIDEWLRPGESERRQAIQTALLRIRHPSTVSIFFEKSRALRLADSWEVKGLVEGILVPLFAETAEDLTEEKILPLTDLRALSCLNEVGTLDHEFVEQLVDVSMIGEMAKRELAKRRRQQAHIRGLHRA